ncbi:MAG: peptidylprolyl isomerase [Candidatus Lokiarchaeota archaeon]|nr:peptidylprolyl isomerase [Candidatus Lokiarchaeota archaeon]
MTNIIIKTTKGDIKIKLFDEQVPNVVKNFLDLVQRGFYNGLTFHRVIPDFMIQGGCMNGTGTGGHPDSINVDCEIKPGIKHKRGSIAMAHAGTCRHDKFSGDKLDGHCSNGAQFYITHKATDWLDGVHTVFGQTTEGMNVVDSIQKGDKIKEIIIE